MIEDAGMGCNWNLYCGWRTSFDFRFIYVGDNISSHTAQVFRALLLHSSALHPLSLLLPSPCWHCLLLPYPPWCLSLFIGSISSVLAIKTKRKACFCSALTFRHGGAELLQEFRWQSNIKTLVLYNRDLHNDIFFFFFTF